MVFSKTRVTRRIIADLILLRVSKWGNASGLLDYADTPLWKVHPQGAVALHSFKLASSFWLNKRLAYDLVCAVGGDWGALGASGFGGGIGGTIHNNRGELLLSFSGPVTSNDPLLTQVEGILYVIRCLINRKLYNLRTIICSDSSRAVNAFNRGLTLEFPLLDFNLEFDHLINNSVFIQFVSQDLNSNAKSLANRGITRPNMSAHWSEPG